MPARTDDITLELDTLKLTLNPTIGCSIMSLMIRNQDRQWAPVLRSMPHNADSSADASSFVMLPWTNRIKDARFQLDGHEYTLNPTNSDNSAIHGVARDLPWTIADRSPITARLTLDSRTFDPQTINYPFKFGATQRFEIGPSSLEIDLSITNLDDHPIPVGCGHHPYFSRQLFSDADKLRIKLDVDGRYPTTGCIPTSDPIDDPVCASLRAGEPIPKSGLDDVFAGFGNEARFTWSASNIEMTMRCSANLHHLVIFTPTDQSGRSTGFVCIEPSSMVNDGFNRFAQGAQGTGVVILEPEQTMRTSMSLAFSTCT